jgi:hypothetical protein
VSSSCHREGQYQRHLRRDRSGSERSGDVTFAFSGALYTLVMASLMITGGKIGQMIAASARLRSGASSTPAAR